tara:strand:- start:195 stop:527 length:333 start_codon:yes stop_codon:yes gene_type:complete
MKEEKQYRPLPSELYVGMSTIEGNGLFTTKFIENGRELGISHVKETSGNFDRDLIRTPVGAFVNHAGEDANCEIYECGEYIKMRTIKDLRAGEELTLNYTLYKPCNYLNK